MPFSRYASGRSRSIALQAWVLPLPELPEMATCRPRVFATDCEATDIARHSATVRSPTWSRWKTLRRKARGSPASRISQACFRCSCSAGSPAGADFGGVDEDAACVPCSSCRSRSFSGPVLVVPVAFFPAGVSGSKRARSSRHR